MKKKKDRLKSDGEDKAPAIYEAPTTMVRPPPAAPVAVKVKAPKADDLAGITPTSWDGAVRLVLDRQEAAGHPRNEKQAKRAASMAWPKLYAAASAPRV